jgi:hypothetical protein
MSTWYAKDLGEAIYGEDKFLHDTLYPFFEREFHLAGGPPEMAVFTRLESEGRIHCGLVVYFSPAAHGAARMVGASPCEKPMRAGLNLVAGESGCWQALFPDKGDP